jgi:hypothetical protein
MCEGQVGYLAPAISTATEVYLLLGAHLSGGCGLTLMTSVNLSSSLSCFFRTRRSALRSSGGQTYLSEGSVVFLPE